MYSRARSASTSAGIVACAALPFLSACMAVPTSGTGVKESDEALFGFNSSYTETRFPIVLVHGLLGFEDLLGVVEYWPGIADALADGGAEVFVLESSPVNSSEARGESLIPQIEEVLAITGAAKVNIFGHSQGSMDARYIAAVRPDLVASVTSIGGPHLGSPVADLVVGDTLGDLPEKSLSALADLMMLLGGADWDTDIDASMGQLSTEGAAEFSERYPAGVPSEPCGEGAAVVDGIRYYSWGGTGHLTNALDPLDAIWALTSLMIPGKDDGLVGQCSSHLGRVLRDDYFQNHIDESNLLFGLVSPLAAQPMTLFRMQANRLKNAGL
jgi:triacylglycerol lipase